ncbi:hypothetical protein SVIOM342S_03967 [Streptomyces violaceorubidus]
MHSGPNRTVHPEGRLVAGRCFRVDRDTPPTAKVGLFTLTAMVVGSMVGAGVFALPARFAEETGVAGALIAWAIAGTGMLTLAFVFQSLAVRRPDLDAVCTRTPRRVSASTWASSPPSATGPVRVWAT